MMSKDATPVAESVEVTQADRVLFKMIVTGMAGASKHMAIDSGGFDTDERMTAIASYRSSMMEALHSQIINTPETADFMDGVPLEAAHQRARWGSDHDGGKTPFDWFWLIGYLAQKAATAQVEGDDEKAKHHTISTAAALANWHAQLTGRTDMRPGIGPDNGGEKTGSAYDLAAALSKEPTK